MPKAEITIEKLIVEGEMTNEKARSLKRLIKTVFNEAWEEHWYQLCVKYPGLKEA